MADVEIEIKLEGEGGEAPVTRKEFQFDIATKMSEDVEREPAIPQGWAANVRKLLADNVRKLPPRVATALTNANPEAYTPRFLSLGPYHYWKLKKGTLSARISTSEQYKVVYTTTAMRQQAANPEKSFECIIVKIEGMLPEIEQFYDTKIEDRNNFSLMMAVDTSFLLCFLFSSFGWAIYPSPSSASSEDDRVIHSGFINLSIIKCDVLKLENQIPLCVLKAVFQEVKHALLPQYLPTSFNRFLLETYRLFSPFLPVDMINADDLTSIIPAHAFQREQHLLGCMHAAVLPFVQMQDKLRVDDVPQWSLSRKTKQFFAMFIEPLSAIFFIKKRHHDFLSGYNAERLGNAGIKFKSFSTLREEIRFDKYTETLYLPPITLSNIHTEVFLKNMLALEFNDTTRRCNSVIRYVALMKCLIKTPRDVHVLRQADVIRRQSLMLTDAYVAKMWDDMRRLFFADHLDPPEELKWELKKVILQNHYKKKMRKVLRRFCLNPLLRAGKIVTWLVAVIGLVFTAVTTYCGIEDCRAILLHRKLKI